MYVDLVDVFGADVIDVDNGFGVVVFNIVFCVDIDVVLGIDILVFCVDEVFADIVVVDVLVHDEEFLVNGVDVFVDDSLSMLTFSPIS